MNPPLDPIAVLLTSYNELNSPHIEELQEQPSALEFMRFVARNRPFVVRGAAADWHATQSWTVGKLKELLQGTSVNVAITPHGNADSTTENEEGHLFFVKPCEEQQGFAEFVDFVAAQERSGKVGEEVRYAQTQNDNLRNEYSTLFSHVQRDIPWARIALQTEPEAINLWIGNSRSVTALHKDNYENIYVQIIGEKHFLLLPPICHPCINEVALPPATYTRTPTSLSITSQPATPLTITPDSSPPVPFATWDPDSPTENPTPYSHLAVPMSVTLQKGDLLYLPALWYHKVSQSCSEEGICVAVNYWYDMEFTGSFYPLCDFVRNVAVADADGG